MSAMTSRTLRLALLLAMAGGAAACGGDATAPTNAPVATAAVQATGPQVVTGVQGPGANYALYLPENWNHELILFAHGWGPTSPPQPATSSGYMPAALRDGLLERGFGVAVTSFTHGGFALKDAGQRTDQLKNLYAQFFGKPDRVYLMSYSLGAAVIMPMVEQNPHKYAGALPICGIVGGVPYQIHYYFDTRVLFDYYFPGVLPGDAVTANGFGTVNVPGLLGSNLPITRELAHIDQISNGRTVDSEMVLDVFYALMFNGMKMFTDDILLATHGRPFYDNTQTVYSGSADDAALNAGVERFAADSDAAKVLENLYSPTGKLGTPVLILNNRADPIVPVRHVAAYRALAEAQNATDYLVTRVVGGSGHCGMPVADMLTAMDDLAAWARTGVKP